MHSPILSFGKIGKYSWASLIIWLGLSGLGTLGHAQTIDEPAPTTHIFVSDDELAKARQDHQETVACEHPFGLANNAIATIVACDMEFQPIGAPTSVISLYAQSPQTFTLCNGHVDNRRYWRNTAPIYLIDEITGIQWVLPAGVISDGASFPPPLRGVWVDRWSGLEAEKMLFEGDSRVPFALVAGFFHDYFMCRIVQAKEQRPEFLDAVPGLKPYETPGCVHEMFEHLLMAFYNTPVLAKVSASTVGVAGWIQGAGAPEPCPYRVSDAYRPETFDLSKPIRSPLDIVSLGRETGEWSVESMQSSLRLGQSAFNWSIESGRLVARNTHNVGNQWFDTTRLHLAAISDWSLGRLTSIWRTAAGWLSPTQ